MGLWNGFPDAGDSCEDCSWMPVTLKLQSLYLIFGLLPQMSLSQPFHIFETSRVYASPFLV